MNQSKPQIRSPYDKGPYSLKDIPKLAVGAAIIGGGIYGVVTLMLKKKSTDELAARGELRSETDPHSLSVRGTYGSRSKTKSKGVVDGHGRGRYR